MYVHTSVRMFITVMYTLYNHYAGPMSCHIWQGVIIGVLYIEVSQHNSVWLNNHVNSPCIIAFVSSSIVSMCIYAISCPASSMYLLSIVGLIE